MLAIPVYSIAYMNKYSQSFKEALKASSFKDADLASQLGVGAANVYHWKEGLRPIPADKAVQIAATLHIDPATISESFDLIAEAIRSLPVAQRNEIFSSLLIDIGNHKSQAARFDPKILVATYRGLKRLRAQMGESFNLEDEPEHFLQAYGLEAELDREAPGADPIGIFRAAGLAKKQGVSADGDGRIGDGKAHLPDDGANEGKVARKVRRKKS